MYYDMLSIKGKQHFLRDLRKVLQEWPNVESATIKDVNRILEALNEVSSLCVRNQSPSQGSIWDAAYGVVYQTLDLVQKKVIEDIGDRDYQAEAIDIPLDNVEAFHYGFDEGLRSAEASVQMIREGSI